MIRNPKPFVFLLGRTIAGAVLLAFGAVLCLGQTATSGGVAGPGTATVGPGFTGMSIPTIQTTQNPFQGGRPTGQITPGIVDLSLLDAIDRGLKYNLGLYLTQQGTLQTRAARLRSLADLLPNINGHIAETSQQINLLALGIPPSFLRGISPIIGPFQVFDARATATETLSLKGLNLLRSSAESNHAADLSVTDARDLVVIFVGAGYIQALSAQARINATQAQLTLAQSLYQQASDMKRAGTIAGIDVLRSQVEMQVQQQRLVAAQNDFEKAKLQLARAIGLPAGQQYRLTTAAPYEPLQPRPLDEALNIAFRERADYQALLAQRRAADLARKAAISERLPSIQFNGDYGTLGPTPGNSHGTFMATGSLQIPIMQSGRIRADIQQADATLRQREAQAEDMRARIETEVRSAYLDLSSASQQVEVARSSIDLANQQLAQARDRFAAGVANNIEVIQAQEAVATVNENFISSLLAHNLAKLELARALGTAEQSVKQYLGGRH